MALDRRPPARDIADYQLSWFHGRKPLHLPTDKYTQPALGFLEEPCGWITNVVNALRCLDAVKESPVDDRLP